MAFRFPLPRSPPAPIFRFRGCARSRARLPPLPCAAEDLDEEGLDQVKASVGEVFDNPPAHATYSEMARRIRVDLDKKMNGGSRGWSVVVGRSFGAYITQKIKNYAYVSVFPGACRGGGGRGRGRLRAWGARGLRARSKTERKPNPFARPPFYFPAHTGVNVLAWKV